MNEIARNIALTGKRIAAACEKAGRNPGEVQLLLATKTVPAEKIRLAFDAGETLIGENKVQELKAKYKELQPFPHQTHFIGHLQTNKIRDVIRYADCIQSLDRPDLAEKLQQRLESEDRIMDVFIQVNTSYENSKFGISPEEAANFAVQVKSFDRLQIRGLMTIGLFSAETDQVRRCFRVLRQLQQQMLDRDIPVHALSMGMSHDLETAIEEGATMIRVGTAVFGKRLYPDSYYWNEAR